MCVFACNNIHRWHMLRLTLFILFEVRFRSFSVLLNHIWFVARFFYAIHLFFGRFPVSFQYFRIFVIKSILKCCFYRSTNFAFWNCQKENHFTFKCITCVLYARNDLNFRQNHQNVIISVAFGLFSVSVVCRHNAISICLSISCALICCWRHHHLLFRF